MGTWGTGYFRNDVALDIIDEIEESSDPKKIISTIINAAAKSASLESNDANAVIICSIYIDNHLNGTKYSSDNYFAEVDNFGSRYPAVDLSGLRENAVIALQKVADERSPISEMWEAAGQDEYREWKKGIDVLKERLST